MTFNNWRRGEPNSNRENPQLILGRFDPFYWYVGNAEFNSFPICEI